MKNYLSRMLIVSSVIVLVSIDVHAIHARSSFSCKVDDNIWLEHDGPGSNYASGGYDNFYLGNNKHEGILAYQNPIKMSNSRRGDVIEEDGKVGDVIGDSEIEVVYEYLFDQSFGEKEVKIPEPNTCDESGYDYEYTKWNSLLIIKISSISIEATRKLGYKAGDIINMICTNKFAEPVRCYNEEDIDSKK